VKEKTLDTPLTWSEKEFFSEGWITKDCDSRRSWIGGEGLPSRDQVKEKREQRQPQVGFSRAKPQERVKSYKFFHTILEVVYTGFNGDRCIYTSLLKERCIHLKSVLDLGHTIEQTFSGLFVVLFLSVGHYPYYESLDFIIIKSSQYWFSLQVFFKGIYPKILVFMCA
jgi:hypothetical protein